MPATLLNRSARMEPPPGLDHAEIEARIQRAANLLPIQRPITSFVTQNPLQGFEHLPFDEGVVEGARLFGCHPYLSEDAYRNKLAAGRIQFADLEAVLKADLGARANETMLNATRLSLRVAMLKYPIRVAPAAELRWLVAESDALRRFRSEVDAPQRAAMVSETRRWIMRDVRPRASNPELLTPAIRTALGPMIDRIASQVESWDDSEWENCVLNLLWRACVYGTQSTRPYSPPTHPPIRHRDILLDASGSDSDLLVNEVLIPFCAAFVDQGFAGVPLPNRDADFFHAFLALYSGAAGPTPRWMQDVVSELSRLKTVNATALESIQESLQVLGVQDDEVDAFFAATCAALRGWTGMIWQAESQPGLTVRQLPAGSLTGFMAVRLILERSALKQIAKDSLLYRGPLARFRDEFGGAHPQSDALTLESRAFQVFQVAQFMGWAPEELIRLRREEWAILLTEIESFSGLNRRRVFHLAFERRYRHRALDALSVRASLPVRQRVRPRFQTVSCMDDREESFRRWLEELCPSVETFGKPGFFGVAMNYRGAGDAHFAPLCPIGTAPKQFVVEEFVESSEETDKRRTRQRRALGAASWQFHVGSRSFTGGALLTTLIGPLASIPLVARVLAPRLAGRIHRQAARFVSLPAVTRLHVHREGGEPGPENGHVGFTTGEAASAAENALRLIGLTSAFARMVFLLGHGSTSVNNPHKAAYDCGACGGSAGGPNARALAQMLNDSAVRKLLGERGVEIPDDTVFVGGWHNTSNESVELFDLDGVPDSHREDLRDAIQLFDDVGDRSAHERCRRFNSAPLDLTFEEARRHVEARAEDLAQTRPELGHATNALFIVGRRDRTRGLFLDRRAFLISYDPTQDGAESATLERILGPAVPVSLGINLEYFFSRIDNQGWGCGTKLPHNVTSLVGVMDGARSDLRMGLPWQTVEIHEPMRLLVVIETTPERMLVLIERNAALKKVIGNGWVQLALLDPESNHIRTFDKGEFRDYKPETSRLDPVDSSVDWYRGWRDHLGFALVRNGLKPVMEVGAGVQRGRT